MKTELNVLFQDGKIYILGKLSTSVGSIDGKFASWFELEKEDAERLAKNILRALES